LLPAGPAAAVDLSSVEACVEAHAASDTLPAPCVAQAMTECLGTPSDAPALASLCFREARDTWSEGIAARMARLKAAAPEEIAAIAGIEVKYDLLGGLLQCDRGEELALVGSGALEEIQRQKDQCTATAAGMAYIRLLWRARDL
jgi:hypothetical protein